MRRYGPIFIAKKELARGIPSISFNYQCGGVVAIDRKDGVQARNAILGLGNRLKTDNISVCIFPEGTRSKTGEPKRFSENGLKILCKYAPSAYVVPISINNSWKMVRFGTFPMGLGNRLQFTIHEPIAIKDFSFPELMEKTEKAVVQGIKN